MLQPLGPTCMKRRHLKESGFRTSSIPYWSLDRDAIDNMGPGLGHGQSQDESKRVLVEALRNANWEV